MTKSDEVMLVQFKTKEPPNSNLVRALKDETPDAAMRRQERHRALKPAESRFRHSGAIPKKLLEVLREDGFDISDAWLQRRVGIGYQGRVGHHVLVTFEFRPKSATPTKRQKELGANGMLLLQKYLDIRWEQVRVSTFPDSPGLQAFLFVGKAQDPRDPVELKDDKAEEFGMTITRRNREKKVG